MPYISIKAIKIYIYLKKTSGPEGKAGTGVPTTTPKATGGCWLAGYGFFFNALSVTSMKRIATKMHPSSSQLNSLGTALQ
jgi:hypothetical protein